MEKAEKSNIKSIIKTKIKRQSLIIPYKFSYGNWNNSQCLNSKNVEYIDLSKIKINECENSKLSKSIKTKETSKVSYSNTYNHYQSLNKSLLGHKRKNNEDVYRLSNQNNMKGYNNFNLTKIKTDSFEILTIIDCIICLSSINNSNYHLSCGHIFHKECILTWMRQYGNCPLCKSSMTHFIDIRTNILEQIDKEKTKLMKYIFGLSMLSLLLINLFIKTVGFEKIIYKIILKYKN